MAKLENKKGAIAADAGFDLKEDKKAKNKRKGVLHFLEGPCMEMEQVNQNNRYYSRELVMEKILNNEVVRTQIQNKSLLGEGRHPENNRFDISYPDVAISVEKLWIPDDDPNKLYGRFAVLDTPVGNILSTLIEYGSKIGVSARAMGTSNINAQGVEVLNPDDYVFYTFDAVPDPGFACARPAVLESRQSNVLVNNIAKAKDLQSLQTVCDYMNDINPKFFNKEIRKINVLMESRKNKELSCNPEERIIPNAYLEKLRYFSEKCLNLYNENLRLRKEIKDLKNNLK